MGLQKAQSCWQALLNSRPLTPRGLLGSNCVTRCCSKETISYLLFSYVNASSHILPLKLFSVALQKWSNQERLFKGSVFLSFVCLLCLLPADALFLSAAPARKPQHRGKPGAPLSSRPRHFSAPGELMLLPTAPSLPPGHQDRSSAFPAVTPPPAVVLLTSVGSTDISVILLLTCYYSFLFIWLPSSLGLTVGTVSSLIFISSEPDT